MLRQETATGGSTFKVINEKPQSALSPRVITLIYCEQPHPRNYCCSGALECISACGGIITGQKSGWGFGPQMVLQEQTDANRVHRKSRELPQSMNMGSFCASAAKTTNTVSQGRWEPPSNQRAGNGSSDSCSIYLDNNWNFCETLGPSSLKACQKTGLSLGLRMARNRGI